MAKAFASLLLAFIFAAASLPGIIPAAARSEAAKNLEKPSAATSKKKPAPAPATKAEPQKQPWDRPLTVVLVRSSVPGCEPLCPEWLSAEGSIVPGSAALFGKALKQIGKRQLPVLIRSPGGDVTAAIAIGRMVRKAGLPVAVGWTLFSGCAPGQPDCRLPAEQKGAYRGLPLVNLSFCNSACPLILAAGTQRLAGEAAFVGLHEIRHSWIREKVLYHETWRTVNGKKRILSREVISRKTVGTFHKDGIDRKTRAQLLAYLAEMGVASGFVDEMEKAAYTDINHVPQQRLRDINLLTSAGTADVLVSPDVCKSTPPAPNCRLLPQAAAAAPKPPDLERPPLPPPKGDEMIVVRVRGKGACEPVCPEWIAAEGTITADTPRRFEDMFERIGETRLPVVIDSRGGDLDAALAIGRMIRGRKLHTLVATTMFFGCKPRDRACSSDRPAVLPYGGYAFTPGYCSRECWFAFAGGVRRLGQWTSPDAASATRFTTRQKGKAAETLIGDFLRDMGLSGLPLTVDRTRLPSNLAPYDDNRIIMFGFTSDPGATDQFAEPDVCKRATPPENCIRRDGASAENRS